MVIMTLLNCYDELSTCYNVLEKFVPRTTFCKIDLLWRK